MRPAERFAAKLEAELLSGAYRPPDRLTWAEFRTRYEREASRGKSARTAQARTTVFNHVETTIAPLWLAAIDAVQISRLVANWRDAKLSESTIGGYLGHLMAALKWGRRMGYIKAIPEVDRPSPWTEPKGRAISREELDRMLEATAAVVDTYYWPPNQHSALCCPWPQRSPAWKLFLEGLWLSGLRLGEMLALHWKGRTIRPELDGKRPMFWIAPEGQKNREGQYLPMAPDFAAFLEALPSRSGHVFDVPGLEYRRMDNVSNVISDIGKAAKIVVASGDRVKYASAHDFRRSFGCRWALKVRPFILKQMMRHKSIRTTEQFYARLDATTVADEIWQSVSLLERTDTFTDT